MWRAVLLFAVGCGFQRGIAAGDALGGIADGSSDAAVDGPPDATPDGPPPPIMFQQKASHFANPGTSITLAYPNAQLSHGLNVVIIGWVNTHSVTSVSDATGNTYVHAGDADLAGMHQTLYYCCNAAGTATNGVTVVMDSSAQVDLRILEYSGVSRTACLDQIASSSGTGLADDSGTATTTHSHELLVASNNTLDTTNAGDAAFTVRGIDSWGNVMEDEIVFAKSTYHAGATQNNSSDWVMQIATFVGQ